MKEYLQQRIKKYNEQWNNIQKKYLEAESKDDELASYYHTELQKTNACIMELTHTLNILEQKERKMTVKDLKKTIDYATIIDKVIVIFGCCERRIYNGYQDFKTDNEYDECTLATNGAVEIIRGQEEGKMYNMLLVYCGGKK